MPNLGLGQPGLSHPTLAPRAPFWPLARRWLLAFFLPRPPRRGARPREEPLAPAAIPRAVDDQIVFFRNILSRDVCEARVQGPGRALRAPRSGSRPRGLQLTSLLTCASRAANSKRLRHLSCAVRARERRRTRRRVAQPAPHGLRRTRRLLDFFLHVVMIWRRVIRLRGRRKVYLGAAAAARGFERARRESNGNPAPKVIRVAGAAKAREPKILSERQ